MKSAKITLLLLLIFASTGGTVEFSIGKDNSRDTVYFKSTAKLEFIEGKTNNISGSITFEPDKVDSGISGVLKVDLRTLKTGIVTRDEHMRENHLKTDDYPFAYFELESVEPLQSLSKYDSACFVTAKGNFYIHGHYREIETKLTLVREKSASTPELITVRANFSLNLDKFKIPRPKALFLKLAETIEIEVIFTAIAGNSPSSIELPDWPKLD
jgi:polyisoprenoid-binding protein YceI